VDVGDDDSLEPTEAEVQADQLLAMRTAWATLTGYATVVSPVMGAAATALTPIYEAIATFAVKKLGQRRIEHAAETLLDAAEAADEPLADFIDKAVADDRRHELFARTLRIAQDTALRDKRRALGRALAAGVMGDDARINEELLFIRAIEDIDEMHIRLLARMANQLTTPLPGWSATTIREQDPGLTDGVLALFGTLETHGLIVRRMPGTRIAGPEQSYYLITQAGQRFIDRLADDTD
jgi:hypothetical protein